MSFDRSKIIAILTGIISLLLGISYLILVQALDSRGGMVPAPIDQALMPNSFIYVVLSNVQNLNILLL